MKTPSESLRSLREELSSAGSPRLKLKLLARAWRRVRELGPSERRALAAEIGIEEAEGILERLARRKGGRVAGRILQRLGLSDDDENLDLPALVKDLRSRPRPPHATSPSKEPPLEPRVTAVASPPAGSPSPPRREPTPTPHPPAPPVSPHDEPTEPLPPAMPCEKPDPALPSRPDPAAATPTMPRLSDRLQGTGTLIRRFRILRESLEANPPLEDAEIDAVLASFPGGWARRRALSCLIRSGQPTTLPVALSLIRALERPWHRRWCAADLIRSRPLSPEEQELIRQQAGAAEAEED